MSVPTMRTPRSPFVRSARSSAAVPGAPDAVTRTVMSRISRAMLLGRRVDARVDQLEALRPRNGHRGDELRRGEEEGDAVPAFDLAAVRAAVDLGASRGRRRRGERRFQARQV